MLKTKLFYRSDEHEYENIPEEFKTLALGNKAARLFDLVSIPNVNVPKFVVLPTNLCRLYYTDPKQAEKYLVAIIKTVLPLFEGKLVSVRSGAPYSMPGLMETVLNVGITVSEFPVLESKMGQLSLFDSLFRLRKMFGEIVLGLQFPQHIYHDPDNHTKGIKLLKEFYSEHNHKTPETLDFGSQLFYTIKAVWESWNGHEAQEYRNYHHLQDTGTGVIIQEMVFGNTKNGATGVMFSSNIDKCIAEIQGEYLENAQGEDVVSGMVTPKNIVELKTTSPITYNELCVIGKQLEHHFKMIQDIEFTISKGNLYILQTRDAKVSSLSKINFLSKNMQTSNSQHHVPLRSLELGDFLVKSEKLTMVEGLRYSQGIGASNGVVVGPLSFSYDQCTESSIFCAEYTTIDMVPSMLRCAGIISLTGGSTSHAAVIARSLQKPCVVGLTGLEFKDESVLSFDPPFCVVAGQTITLDATNERVYWGKGKVVKDAQLNKQIKSIWSYLHGMFPGKVLQYHQYIPVEWIKGPVCIDPRMYNLPFDSFVTCLKQLPNVKKYYDPKIIDSVTFHYYKHFLTYGKSCGPSIINTYIEWLKDNKFEPIDFTESISYEAFLKLCKKEMGYE